MPVPALPFDVIELVFDHLSLLDERERREVAKPLALVCRDWLPLARRLGWSEVTIVLRKDDELLNHLVRQDCLLESVRTLHLLGQQVPVDYDDDPNPAPTDEDRAKSLSFPFISGDYQFDVLFNLLQSVPALVELQLPDGIHAPNPLAAALMSPSRPSIRRLRLFRYNEPSFETLFGALSGFTNLADLQIETQYRKDYCEAEPVPEVRLALASLQISMSAGSSSNFHFAFSRALCAVLDPSTHKRLRVGGLRSDTTLTIFLQKCINLVGIEIVGLDLESVSANLRALTAALPHLTSLATLVYRVGKEDDPLDVPDSVKSPIKLQSFLDSTPPSLAYIKIGGVVWSIDPSLPVTGLADVKSAATTFIAVGHVPPPSSLSVDDQLSNEADDDDEESPVIHIALVRMHEPGRHSRWLRVMLDESDEESDSGQAAAGETTEGNDGARCEGSG